MKKHFDKDSIRLRIGKCKGYIIKVLAISAIAVVLGLIIGKLVISPFITNASNITYMSYYYDFYSRFYNFTKVVDEEEVSENLILVSDDEYTERENLPELLSLINGKNPAVIGLDVVYINEYPKIVKSRSDSLKMDSINYNLVKAINNCGDKIVLTAFISNESDGQLIKPFFCSNAELNSDIEIGTASIPDKGFFQSNDTVDGEVIERLPVILAKKYYNYCNEKFKRLIINYRLYRPKIVTYDKLCDSALKLDGKIVIIGTSNMNQDKIVLPYNLSYKKVEQSESYMKEFSLYGVQMPGLVNHGYTVRSLINSGEMGLFKLRKEWNFLWNVAIVLGYTGLFVSYQSVEDKKKKKSLIKHFVLGVYIILICFVLFLFTGWLNVVFDLSLALFSIVFVKVGDTVLSCFSASLFKRNIKLNSKKQYKK